ncbi:MAG: methyltransferase domain-containing protein [Spirochaetaceae bacterium]|nr:methyltransferase domain-containing protein [Spirochaetaceae bacterium]
MSLPILLVPCTKEGRGGGHLARCKNLQKDLQELGREAILYKADTNINRVWGAIILDNFSTSREEYQYFSALGPTIAIDDGSKLPFDWTLNLLPALSDTQSANLNDISLNPLPFRRKENPFRQLSEDKPLQILISFGAEDKAGLTQKYTEKLLAMQKQNTQLHYEITVVLGPLNKSEFNYPVRIEKNVEDLKESFFGFDLLISHFGLGAFESLYAGTAVLLAHPTAYHRKLAYHAGFADADTYIQTLPASIKEINRISKKVAERYNLLNTQYKNLADYINELEFSVPKLCPVCGEADVGLHTVIARFPQKTYKKCPRCGMVYMLRNSPPPIEYNDEYFFDNYKKQYGKTYIEDWPHLKEVNKERVRWIRRLMPLTQKSNNGNGEQRLLEIGCAYGPLLAAAEEAGFKPLGIEIEKHAAEYVREKLHIPCVTSSFPSPARQEFQNTASFDAIVLNYVIEHFRDVEKVLAEIKRLLKKGGILAFATPSCSGISGRKNLKAFLKNSPEDHWTVWSPKLAKKVLKHYGFKVRKIVITGHHPERFPLKLPQKLLMCISRLFNLGDTFEVYAEKI